VRGERQLSVNTDPLETLARVTSVPEASLPQSGVRGLVDYRQCDELDIALCYEASVQNKAIRKGPILWPSCADEQDPLDVLTYSRQKPRIAIANQRNCALKMSDEVRRQRAVQRSYLKPINNCLGRQSEQNPSYHTVRQQS
jgi:hypothetical protein